jgi:UDP-N-acetylmuramoyl-tripeptide--D-alanyl-D-alanine ligase
MTLAVLDSLALKRWPIFAEDRLPLALWDAQAIAEATGGTASGNFQCSGVEMDSRDVRNGDLFVALKGETMDGHVFVEAAFANGAAAALVEHPVDFPHVLVSDSTAALAALAAAARSRTPATIVGVTGSVGKTGVKEAIFAALERCSRGATHRSTRSYNNHVGVPLSLARMPARSKFAVFEMGMNHAGEINVLTRQVRPHVALITTIAPAHIENLGSMEAIADAKAEIFGGLVPGGTAVIPTDTPHFEQLEAAARKVGAQIISFGSQPHATVRLLDAIPSANGGSLVTCEHPLGRLCYTVAEPGAHWIANSLGVMAAVLAAGGDLAAAGLALAEMGGLKGRGARHRVAAAGGHALLIDESYNANPASMRATLKTLADEKIDGKRIAVLGAMKELGAESEAFHADLAEPVAAACVEYAILVGEEMSPLAKALGQKVNVAHVPDAAAALEPLRGVIASGDAILVKGSNSVGLARVVEALAGKS